LRATDHAATELRCVAGASTVFKSSGPLILQSAAICFLNPAGPRSGLAIKFNYEKKEAELWVTLTKSFL
jgi:hypothetical protein